MFPGLLFSLLTIISATPTLKFQHRNRPCGALSISSFFPCDAVVVFQSASNLFDPSPSLPFRDLLPERCVPARLPSTWLPVLRDAGMATKVKKERNVN
jgi:hypothetical protein